MPSAMHTKWVGYKKEAEKDLTAAVIKKLLNKNLGGAWDNYFDLIKGAWDVKKMYPDLEKTSAKTLVPVVAAKGKVETILRDYVRICAAEKAKNTYTDAQKKAWNILSGYVEGWSATPALWLKDLKDPKKKPQDVKDPVLKHW